MTKPTPAQIAELEAMREWARIGLALYTGAVGAIAMFYPEYSQVPLNQPVRAYLQEQDDAAIL